MVTFNTSCHGNDDNTEPNTSSSIGCSTEATSPTSKFKPLEQQLSFDISLWKYINESQRSSADNCIEVNIIIPVHNASTTIRETIHSAMNQVWIHPLHPTDNEPKDSNDVSRHKPHQQIQERVVPNITVQVFCYNDASTDDSWIILQELFDYYAIRMKNSAIGKEVANNTDTCAPSIHQYPIPTQLWISSSPPGCNPRGPGYARNRAVQMRDTVPLNHYPNNIYQHFICWLDSDDIMDPTRIYCQIHTMMQLLPTIRLQTLLGTNFYRFITTSTTTDKTINDNNNESITPHYTKWANSLSHERLYLERYREVTIIQPTWMMCHYRYVHILHGYLEYPNEQQCSTITNNQIDNDVPTTTCQARIPQVRDAFTQWIQNLALNPTVGLVLGKDDEYDVDHNHSKHKPWRLVHPEMETIKTIRIAEDLRFFHEHLYHDGLLQRTMSDRPLLAYRFRPDISQSAQTSRKLLLALRVASFEYTRLLNSNDEIWNDRFIVWGAGRDGKDFVKALTPAVRRRVYCYLDVDDTKIARGYYNYYIPRTNGDTKQQNESLNIPIVHFSLAMKDANQRSRMYELWKCVPKKNSFEGKPNLEECNVVPYFGRIVKNQDPNISMEFSLTNEEDSQRKRFKTISSTETKQDPGITKLDFEAAT